MLFVFGVPAFFLGGMVLGYLARWLPLSGKVALALTGFPALGVLFLFTFC